MLSSRQRAYLKSLAVNENPVIWLGKASLTTENAKNIDQALAARELIKIGVLKNCEDDPKTVAEAAAEMTRSEVVQVIGKKIVLYRQGVDDKRRIQLPE